MAKVKVYNLEGKAVGDIELDAKLFEVEINPNLVHEAVVAQQANSRQAIAHAKDRSEVRGGGRKPWRQKGTGRARAGSNSSPIWRGGGVTFGPSKDRNFSKKMNRKAKQRALAMTLTDKLAHEKIVVVDTLEIVDGKTKNFVAAFAKLPVAGKKTLVVIDPKNETVKRSVKNLQKIETISAKSLNVVDVLSYDYLLMSKDAVELMNQTYAK